MNWDRAFTGGCSCGRNQFAIVPPADVGLEQAEVYFDASSDNRRTQAAPLTTWLRVPLDWYQSFTRSFFPDETHNAIRRTFVPLHAPYCQRNFCGFCGTPLTYWSEDPLEEADRISVTVGSLSADDQAALEDLDLLPTDSDVEVSGSPSRTSPVVPVSPSSQQVTTRRPQPSVSHRSGTIGGIPWFEEMIEGSRLGQYGRRLQGRGGTADSSVQIEWEVSEWYGDNQGESATTSTGDLLEPGAERSSAKRKSPE